IKTEFEVAVALLVSTNIIVGKKNWDWKKAAKAASIQLSKGKIFITVGEYDCIIDWQEVKKEDCSSDGSDWEVNVKAEVITYINGIDAANWKQAADKALQVAQDNLEIISDTDVSIDWQPITEDMVN
ncbi:MAG: hypothetical protein ACKPCP_30980, partial [Sphaerospermopsis kisseleviana]